MKNKTKLTNYLTGVAGIAAITAPQANAAVTAITFGIGSTLQHDEEGITSTTPNYGGLWMQSYANPIMDVSFTAMGRTYSGGDRVYHNSSLGSLRGLITFFAPGTVIGNGTNGNAGIAYFEEGTTPLLDLTSNQTGYIGFKTSTNNWGYADVSWNEASKILTINSAFVESVPNTSITIPAAVPEPSSLALLAAGSVLAARRRRKAA